MKEDNLDELFRKLQGSFDTELPRPGHEKRFLEKLNPSGRVIPLERKRTGWWKPLAIAATLAFLCMLGIQLITVRTSVGDRVAEISPEISRTDFYFTSLVEEQVRQLESHSTPETQHMVADALQQLQKLENSYNTMEQDLLNGGDSKLILSAMIANFQTRIDLIKEVVEKIESVKTKTNDNENYTI